MTDLTIAEHKTLARHEAVITAGQKHFVAVGNALAAIRDAKLYREDHDTFADYCRERWGLNKSRAYQFIEAAAVVNELPSTNGGCEVLNERQARALAEVPPDLRAGVIDEIVEAGEKPTAKRIAQAAARRMPEPEQSFQDEVPGDVVDEHSPAPVVAKAEPNTIGEAKEAITDFLNEIIAGKPSHFLMAIADHLQDMIGVLRA